MQPTNFSIVNNFFQKNRQKKEEQGSFVRFQPYAVCWLFFIFPPKRSQSRKHTTSVQQPGPTQLRERRFSTSFFFFFSHVIIRPPIPSEKQIGQNWKSFPFCTVTWHACIPARKEKKVQSQIFFLSRKVFFSFQKILPLKDALESILKIEHNSGSARTLGQKT